MKPPPFDYRAPDSLEEALALLAERGAEAKVLAGGQSLLPLLNFRLASPALLVDLNRLSDLAYVRPGVAGGLRIGAMTRQRSLEREALVAETFPLLREAALHIAHPQIRNRGTVGGSLAHADPAAELPALATALRARYRLVSARGERWVPADEFYLGLLTTALEPDEILVEVELPPLPAGIGWSFQEATRRQGDYAQLGLPALLATDGEGVCREARLVYFSVGDGPVEAGRAAELLEGRLLEEEALVAAAELASEEEIDPAGDIHATASFKRHLAGVLTLRALRQAARRADRAEGSR